MTWCLTLEHVSAGGNRTEVAVRGPSVPGHERGVDYVLDSFKL